MKFYEMTGSLPYFLTLEICRKKIIKIKYADVLKQQYFPIIVMPKINDA